MTTHTFPCPGNSWMDCDECCAKVEASFRADVKQALENPLDKSKYVYFAVIDDDGDWNIGIGQPEGYRIVDPDTDLGGKCESKEQADAIATRANRAYLDIGPEEAARRRLAWTSQATR